MLDNAREHKLFENAATATYCILLLAAFNIFTLPHRLPLKHWGLSGAIQRRIYSKLCANHLIVVIIEL